MKEIKDDDGKWWRLKQQNANKRKWRKRKEIEMRWKGNIKEMSGSCQGGKKEMRRQIKGGKGV